MIPADLASRLRLASPDQPEPVQPAVASQKITDVLSDLSAGQRIMAEIQALLPNGTYRAVVAQRELTLSLPFSAKAGDMLEMEVRESDGKLSLAFIANRSASENTTKSNDSVATTLSKTGNLIGNLLNDIEEKGGQAKPAALNANQPLVTEFPENAKDLAPILKESLIKSGMFYEAHQARWVEGKLTTANLLQEPQGKLSTLIPASPPSQSIVHATNTFDPAEIAAHVHLSEASLKRTTIENEALKNASIASESAPAQLSKADPNNRETPGVIPSNISNADNSATSRGTPVHPELTPIVQQQLNALATQTYVWQGQVWPGQNMHWEITEDDGRPHSGDEEVSGHWQTRLKLDLPNLGSIDARIGLDLAGKLSISLRTRQAESQEQLQLAAAELGKSLERSGLQLNKFSVKHEQISG